MCPVSPRLLRLPVIDVVLMGGCRTKPFFARFNREDLRLAREALEKLSIPHLEERPYTEISGGERQLVLIARAMTQGAHTFIFDERPTAWTTATRSGCWRSWST